MDEYEEKLEILTLYYHDQVKQRDQMQRALEHNWDLVRRMYSEKEKLVDRIHTVLDDFSESPGEKDTSMDTSSVDSDTTQDLLRCLPPEHALRKQWSQQQDPKSNSPMDWQDVELVYSEPPPSRASQHSVALSTSASPAQLALMPSQAAAHESSMRGMGVTASGATTTATTTATTSGNVHRPFTSRKTPENRVRKYKEIQRNPVDGSFTISAKHGSVTVLDLGTVLTEEGFHNERYIFPFGFCSRRTFMSTVDPLQDDANFLCRITRGEYGAQFEVLAEDGSGIHTQSRSASGAWTTLMNTALQIRGKPATNSVSGPELFGLGAAEVAKLIQEMPGARDCHKYKWQTFVLDHRGSGGGARLAKSDAPVEIPVTNQ